MERGKCLPHSLDLRDGIWTGEETEVVLESHLLKDKTKTKIISLFLQGFFTA